MLPRVVLADNHSYILISHSVKLFDLWLQIISGCPTMSPCGPFLGTFRAALQHNYFFSVSLYLCCGAKIMIRKYLRVVALLQLGSISRQQTSRSCPEWHATCWQEQASRQWILTLSLSSPSIRDRCHRQRFQHSSSINWWCHQTETLVIHSPSTLLVQKQPAAAWRWRWLKVSGLLEVTRFSLHYLSIP